MTLTLNLATPDTKLSLRVVAKAVNIPDAKLSLRVAAKAVNTPDTKLSLRVFAKKAVNTPDTKLSLLVVAKAVSTPASCRKQSLACALSQIKANTPFKRHHKNNRTYVSLSSVGEESTTHSISLT